ncbi:GntR family transcriptional regulator [Paracoccus sp. 22332]|uniref:GntR family transcriptional regulator n=1 Tax=Paracoccus sp. 22332 TaxID=3453913 RepID=UPI003F850EAD
MPPPLYQSVIDEVVARIASGQLLPGGMLPSETQLAAETGVSQGTARKALIMLEQHGIVRREQGRGTFITARTPEGSLFNFFRLRPRDGRILSPQVEQERISSRPATQDEQASLQGAPATVTEIRRIRSINGAPCALEISVVSADLFPGLERRSPLPSALYVLYQQAYGCIILNADESIAAEQPDAETRQALTLPADTPVLRVERVAHDILGRSVERRLSFFRTDQLNYMIRLD